MKYNYLSLGLLALSASAFGQVGVGTTNPAATLHVAGKPTTASSADGIIPPIISRTNLMAKTGYAANQKGAILYVDDISGTAPAAGSPTEFVNGIGYYYFDGGKWMKFSNAGNPVNMYNTDGSLTSPRTVAQGSNTLAFTSTATNGFSVDGNTLSVDAANNRVGLGTAAPTNALHVNAATDPVKLSGLQADATAANIVVADATGVLKTIPKTSLASTNIYNSDGSLTSPRTVTQGSNTLAFNSIATNGFSVDGTTLSVDAANNRVGLGTAAPTNALHVNAATDPVKLSGLQADATAANIVVADATGVLKTIPKTSLTSTNIYNSDGSLTSPRTVTQGPNPLAFTSTTTNGFSVDGTTLSVDAANNRIGVGTAAPTNTLHVNATADPVKLSGLQADATAANIVVADATGTLKTLPKTTFSTSNIYTADGSLTNPRTVTQGANTLAFTSTATNGFSVDGTTLSVDAANNRVGIGTTTPTTTLDVEGNARFRQVPALSEKKSFYSLGVDETGSLMKDVSISTYSTYLGFSPIASTHTDVLPFTIESGFITKITGTSIGACNGVMVDFTIQFLGTTYLGATLQARPTTNSTTTYAAVNLSKNQSVFGKPLEVLANAGCGATSTSGHTLSFSNGIITDTFVDNPTYFPNAGLFTIYSINKIKQTNQ